MLCIELLWDCIGSESRKERGRPAAEFDEASAAEIPTSPGGPVLPDDDYERYNYHSLVFQRLVIVKFG